MLALPTRPQIAASPVVLFRRSDIPHPERSVARGELLRIRPGVFAEATQWTALRPWEQYLARVHAVALQRPDAVFCHESAAALLGMPVIGDPRIVHILVPRTLAARETRDIRSHRVTRMPELMCVDGLIVTTPTATAVGIARYRQHAIGLAAADAALRRDPTITTDTLRGDNETRATSRGRAHARWVIERASARRESVLESVSDAALEWLGFPPSVLQQEFVAEDGQLDRGDYWWADIGLLGEADGEFKYDGRFGEPAALLRARHARDRRLLRSGARAIAHWGWIDVARVWPLRDLLVGHGLSPVRPPDLPHLQTLMQALAPYDRLLTASTRRRATASAERTSPHREYS